MKTCGAKPYSHEDLGSQQARFVALPCCRAQHSHYGSMAGMLKDCHKVMPSCKEVARDLVMGVAHELPVNAGITPVHVISMSIS